LNTLFLDLEKTTMDKIDTTIENTLFNINGMRFASEIKEHLLKMNDKTDILELLLFVEEEVLKLYLEPDKIAIYSQSIYSSNPYSIGESVYNMLTSRIVVEHISKIFNISDKNRIISIIKNPATYMRD